MTFQGCSLTFNQLEGELMDISFIRCGTIETFHTAMNFQNILFKGGSGVFFDSISNNAVLGCTFDSTDYGIIAPGGTFVQDSYFVHNKACITIVGKL